MLERLFALAHSDPLHDRTRSPVAHGRERHDLIQAQLHEPDAQRGAYLEYLRQCLRQGREPADEVVELMRGSLGAADTATAGTTLALQIRTAEEQLGIAPIGVQLSEQDVPVGAL